MSLQTSRLVHTETSYVAIYDSESPINRAGFLEEQLRTCMMEAVAAGEKEFTGIVRFEERLKSLAAHGEVLPWTLLSDGVYQVTLAVEEHKPMQESALGDLSGASLCSKIVCRSGRMHLSCMSRLGRQDAPVITLRPGNYLVSVERRDEVERARSGGVTQASVRSSLSDWSVRFMPLIDELQAVAA